MRLLLVEDNFDLALAMAELFEKRTISCDRASTAADAEHMILTTTYAAIILDLGLPDEDGLDLLRRLRGSGRIDPILILTARSDADMRVKGLRLGADDYLGKPFLFDELHARVEAILRRRGGYVERCVAAGDVSLDIETREVIADNQTLELSAREVELLEILIRRQGHVTPRSLLEDQLFGAGDSLGSNALEVYVHRLRKKLDRVSKTTTIRTVRGVGYLLFEER